MGEFLIGGKLFGTTFLNVFRCYMSKEASTLKGDETLKSHKGRNALFRLVLVCNFFTFLMFQKVTSEY